MATEYGTQPAWPPEPTPPTVPPAAQRRPGWVTTSAVLLLAVGALSALAGVLLLVVGFAFGSEWTDLLAGQPGMPENVDMETASAVLTGVLIVIGVISLLWAIAHVAAGIGVLAGHGWARVTAIVLAVIGLLFSLGAVAVTIGGYQSMSDPGFREATGLAVGDATAASLGVSLAFLLPFVIGYVIVLVALIRNGRFFTRPDSRTRGVDVEPLR